jgi:hypothetical protein
MRTNVCPCVIEILSKSFSLRHCTKDAYHISCGDSVALGSAVAGVAHEQLLDIVDFVVIIPGPSVLLEVDFWVVLLDGSFVLLEDDSILLVVLGPPVLLEDDSFVFVVLVPSVLPEVDS